MGRSPEKPGVAAGAKFIAASTFGAFFFFFPINDGGAWKIPLGFLTDAITARLRPALDEAAVALVIFSAVATLACKIAGKQRIESAEIDRLFNPDWLWVLLRVLGAATIAAIYWRFGPDWIHSEAVGGVVMNDLAVVLIVLFFVAGLVLPFLTDYGLMEFIGALASRSFRRVFTVPGRSAVDAAASWIGSGTVGVLITLKQYEQGYYSVREAAVIATNFSITSTAFCYVIAKLLNVEHLFIQYYGVVVAASLTCAVILPRLPPLSLKRDDYFGGAPAPGASEEFAAGLSAGYRLAAASAAAAATRGRTMNDAAGNVLDIWFGLLPCVIFIATMALALASYTPLFDYLALPFRSLLELVGLPEARAAAPAMVIGFADMFLPAIVGQSIASEETRFFIAVVTVGQLIYMSEIGILILRSAIPVNFLDLVLIFLLRTLVVLPFAFAGARLVT